MLLKSSGTDEQHSRSSVKIVSSKFERFTIFCSEYVLLIDLEDLFSTAFFGVVIEFFSDQDLYSQMSSVIFLTTAKNNLTEQEESG